MLPTALVAGSYVSASAKKELDWTANIVRGAKKLPAKRVQEHLSLQGFAVDVDGDFGDATEKRVRDFQAAKHLPVTGQVDFATFGLLVDPMVRALRPIAAGGKTMSQLVVDYSRQHVAQRPREVGGPNAGPWVRMYLGWEGVEAKWCSGFICYALEAACDTLKIKQPIATSASCDTMAMEAKAAKKFVAGSKLVKAALVPGSFFLVRKTPTDWTHIGIVSNAGANSFDTVEGNTDSNGSSNGTEAAERARNYADKDFIIW